MSEKLLKSVGLAARARKLTFGSDMTCDAVKSGKVKLVLLLDSAAKNSEKKILRCCEVSGVEVFTVSIDPYELAHAVGKRKPLMSVGITDENLSVLIRQSIARSDGRILTVSESEV